MNSSPSTLKSAPVWMINYLCPLHGSTDGTALHGRHASVFPAPARCLSWVPLCGGAEAAGEPTQGKSLLSAPSIGRGGSLFRANSCSQAAAPANARRVGFPRALGQLLGIGVLIRWLLFMCAVKWRPPVSVLLEERNMSYKEETH